MLNKMIVAFCFVLFLSSSCTEAAPVLPISQLPNAGKIQNSDQIPVNRIGVTSRVTVGNIAAQDASNAIITGGTIDNTVIGANSAAQGEFTELSVSGDAQINNSIFGNYIESNGNVVADNNLIGQELDVGVANIFNGGTFTANGTTAVVVSNTSVTTSSVIIPWLKTVGGTPACHPYGSAITAGVGFSVKACAGDTSVYNYTIIN